MNDFIVSVQAHFRDVASSVEELDESIAKVMRANADFVGEYFEAYQNTELPLSRAAEESGYSYSALYRMVQEGRLPASKEGVILVQRKHLPRKPGEIRGPLELQRGTVRE